MLAVLLVAILTALWFFMVARMIRAGVWGEALTRGTELEPSPPA